MSVKAAFQPEILSIDTTKIITIKALTPESRKSEVYRRIAASLEHVGLIEPLVVFPSSKGMYLLLDGHTRLDILTATGATSVNCLLSTDNESYTFNKRVNHIPPIAQHHMILKALAHVSEERVAKALNVSVTSIRDKRDLLKGICPEVAELLRDERVSQGTFTALRKMKPIRQIDAAQLMINARKFTGRFARALLDGTREELLVQAPSKQRRAVSSAEQSLMEQETEEMLKHAGSIRANYGNDVLDLTATSRYIERLFANGRVHRYLSKHHPETLKTIEQLLADIEADRNRQPESNGTGIAASATGAGRVNQPVAQTNPC